MPKQRSDNIDLLTVGHASYDITMSAPHHPDADEKLQAEALMLSGGGPAANAAITAARMGGRSAFLGYLGRDPFGQQHKQEFLSENVDISMLIEGKAPTPISQILAKADGSRSVVNYKKDTPWLSATEINWKALTDRPPRAILLDGHEPLLSHALIRWAKQQHIPTILDAGSVHQGTEALALQVNHLVASQRFACQYSHQNAPRQALAALTAKRANSARCHNDSIVITRGAAGLLWQRNGEEGELPAFPVKAIDSTGAGDAFHGAFALAIARNMAWPELLRTAAAAGAITCTRLGARPALPNSTAIEQLLN